MPIDFGGGMIFPSSYDRDPPDPPECPCEDGEPCAVHRACEGCGKPYVERDPEEPGGLCWTCNGARIAALPPVPGITREDYGEPAHDADVPF